MNKDYISVRLTRTGEGIRTVYHIDYTTEANPIPCFELSLNLGQDRYSIIGVNHERSRDQREVLAIKKISTEEETLQALNKQAHQIAESRTKQHKIHLEDLTQNNE